MRGSLMGLLSDQIDRADRLELVELRGGLGAALALVDQLAVDLRADGHLDQLVLHVTYDLGPRTEFDPLGRLDVALDRAVQPHMGRGDDPFDAASLADRKQAALLVRGDHVAAHVAVDMQPALELDVALDPRVRADQRTDRRLPALFSSKHRRSFLQADAAHGRPIERLRQRLSPGLGRPDLDLDPGGLEADGENELLLEPLEVAEIVLELVDRLRAGQLLEPERRRLPVEAARHLQSYNARRPAVLRDRLHQHDTRHVALLAAAGQDLDVLHAQARLAVRRRDDPPIERELLLLGLQLRFELGQRELDLRIRLAVDLARGLEHRDLALQLVDELLLLRRAFPKMLDLGVMIEQRVAGLVPAELEHEIGASENERAHEPDKPGAGASHFSRWVRIIAGVLSQPASGRTKTRFTPALS